MILPHPIPQQFNMPMKDGSLGRKYPEEQDFGGHFGCYGKGGLAQVLPLHAQVLPFQVLCFMGGSTCAHKKLV